MVVSIIKMGTLERDDDELTSWRCPGDSWRNQKRDQI